MIRQILGLALSAGALSMCSAQPQVSPNLDGLVTASEWEAATTLVDIERVALRRLMYEESLYLGVESDRGGILTVYIASNGDVRVLHASDAIAEAQYKRSEDAYLLARGFGEWDRSTDASGQDAFLAAHGWVSSIGRMGPPGHREMVIDLSRLPEDSRIAISYASAPEYETLFVFPTGLTDDTRLTEVQRGFLPETIAFDIDAWMTIGALTGEEDTE